MYRKNMECLDDSLLEVYKALVLLMPRVAFFGIKLRAQLTELVGAEGLGVSAAGVAL